MGLADRELRLSNRMQPDSFDLLYLSITGSLLPNGTATNAAFTMGKYVAVARDDGSNGVTITFNEPLRSTPILVSSSVNTADGSIDPGVLSNTGFAYTSVKRSDHSALVHADVTLTFLIPRGIEVV